MSFLRKLLNLTVHDQRDASRIALLLAGMLVAGAFEALGIGLIMPFIAVIDRPEIIEQSRTLLWLRDTFHLGTTRSFISFFGLILIATFVFKNAYLALYQFVQFRFIFSRQAALSRRLFSVYLRSPYSLHLQRNSADLLRIINSDIPVVFNHVMVSVFVLFVETVSVAVVAGLVIFYEPILVPAIALVTGGFGFLFYRSIRHKTTELGRQQLEDQASMIKAVNHGIGGLKELKILGRESYFITAYDQNSQRFGRALSHHRIVSLLPRYFLETLGMVGLVGFTLSMLMLGKDLRTVLPVLGLLAVAAVRLMPSLSRIMGAIAEVRSYTPAVEAIHADLLLPQDKSATPTGDRHASVPSLLLPFERELQLNHVEYTYPGTATPSLQNVSCTIRRGEAVAFIGPSGAGKTTVVDVLIGLLEPTRGTLEVDGEPLQGSRIGAWQRGIGYIPQHVYLSDDSIRRNVAFGVDEHEIDDARVWRALEAAQLAEFVTTLPDRFNTSVGERGVRLSGGQRQRIGIARALYQEPQVLVLDEATSALDSTTEREIVESIERLRHTQTIIVIAHRLSTVRTCDRLVLMKAGRVEQIGTWDDLVATSEEFRRLTRGSRHDEQAVAMPASVGES
jgi:ABC-type multidrug transport system fused ATPase/permease subunit